MIGGLCFNPQIVHATSLSQEVKDRIALYPSYYAEEYTNVEQLYRFLLPVSDQRKLKASDLDSFSPFELRLALNEISARKGNVFKDKRFQNYFEEKPWYKPNPAFKVKGLSTTEQYNIDFIQRIEIAEAARIQRFDSSDNFRILQTGEMIQGQADLDGEGTQEIITLRQLKTYTGEGTGEIEIQVGNAHLTVKGISANTHSLSAVRLFDNAPEKVLAVYHFEELERNGTTYLFQYDGKTIRMLKGVLRGDTDNLRFDGRGNIMTTVYAENISFYPTQERYKVDRMKITPLKQEYSTVNAFVSSLRSIPLVTAPNSTKASTSIPKDEMVLIRRNKGDWFELISESGKIGWLEIKGYSKKGAEALDNSYFQLLPYSD